MEEKEVIKKDLVNEQEVKDILNALNIDKSIIEKFPQILEVKSSKVQNIIEEMDKLNIPRDIIHFHPEIIQNTNMTRLKENINILNRENIPFDILKDNPEIIGEQKGSYLAKIIKILKENNLNIDFILRNGDILSFGEPKNIKKNIEYLKEKNFYDLVIENNPKAIYKNNEKVVKDIIEYYLENGKEDVLKNNLFLLSDTTKVRIKAVENVLKRAFINENILDEIPNILIEKQTKDIEKSIKLLKTKKIDSKEIEENPRLLLLSEEEVKEFLMNQSKVKKEFKNIAKLIEKEPLLLSKLNEDEVKKYDEMVKDPNSILKIENLLECSETILNRKQEDILKILSALEVTNLFILDKCPDILKIKSAGNILKIKNILEDNKINKKFMEDYPNIFLEFDEDIDKLNERLINFKKTKSYLKENNEIYDILMGIKKIENIDLVKQIDQTDLIKEDDKKSELKIVEEKIEEPEKAEINENKYDLMKVKEINDFLKDRELEKAKISKEIYEYGDIKNMEEVYNFLADFELEKLLLDNLKILLENVSKIKKNLDILIENGYSENVLKSLDLLLIETDELERKLYLKNKNEDKISEKDLLMDLKDFLKYEGMTKEAFDKIELNEYGQDNISNMYKKYLDVNSRNITEDEGIQFEKIYSKILDYGQMKNSLEYIKCGKPFSIIKIEENLYKIIVGINDYEERKILDLDDFYINEIITLSILGNRRISKKEANMVLESILRQVKEDDWILLNSKPQKEEEMSEDEEIKSLEEEIRRLEEQIEKEKALNKELGIDENDLQVDIIINEKPEKEEEHKKVMENVIDNQFQSENIDSIFELKEKEDNTLNKVKSEIDFEKFEKLVNLPNKNEYSLDGLETEIKEEKPSFEKVKLDIKNEIERLKAEEQKRIIENASLETNKKALDINLGEDFELIDQDEVEKVFRYNNIEKPQIVSKEYQAELNRAFLGKDFDFGIKDKLAAKLENSEITLNLEDSKEFQNDFNNENVNINIPNSNFRKSLRSSIGEEDISNINHINLDENINVNGMSQTAFSPIKLGFMSEIKDIDFAPQNTGILKNTFEEDIQKGKNSSYSDFEKQIESKAYENLILSDLERLEENKIAEKVDLNNVKVDSEEVKRIDENLDKIKEMESKLDHMTSSLKEFSIEVKAREAEIASRERKKIQEIKDMRERNKTREEALKLEETARKLEEKARQLEEERKLLEKEKEKELIRIRLEEEKIIAELVKKEAHKIIKEQGILEAKEKFEKAAKDLEIEKMYKDAEVGNNLEYNVGLNVNKEIEFPDDISAYKNLNKDSFSFKKDIVEINSENINAKNILDENNKININNQQNENNNFQQINNVQTNNIETKNVQNTNFESMKPKEVNANKNSFDDTFLNNGQKEMDFFGAEFMPEPKDYFELEDYGYLTQIVNDEEEIKLKKSMNEIFKLKKMGLNN